LCDEAAFHIILQVKKLAEKLKAEQSAKVSI
jgi:hypothetical protein